MISGQILSVANRGKSCGVQSMQQVQSFWYIIESGQANGKNNQRFGIIL